MGVIRLMQIMIRMRLPMLTEERRVQAHIDPKSLSSKQRKEQMQMETK